MMTAPAESSHALFNALGLAPGDRAVVVHVDDLGMCPAANRGGVRALDGTATCGSIMVPCPAFDEIAEVARARPELDLGVHLTLCCEYESYRWGPLARNVPGLQAPDGGMWRTTEDTVAHASADEVERELRAQIDTALGAGIDVTHLDSHMGTVFDLKYARVYLKLAREYRLPVFVPRIDRKVLEVQGMADKLAPILEIVEEAESAGFPIFDHFNQDSLHFEPETGLAHNTARVTGFGPGLCYLITHCAEGDDELASIAPDWRQRDEEQRLYSDGSMARVFKEHGIETLGMRPLRDFLRS